MPIADELSAVVRKAVASKLLPTMLPLTYASDLATGDNTVFKITPPTISPDVPVILDGISVKRVADVRLKLTFDRFTYTEEASAYDGIGEIDPYFHRALRNTSLVLNNRSGGVINNYTLFAGLWVVRPSIAWKHIWNIPLTDREKALATEKNVIASVDKGVLPFPLSYEISREYIGTEETKGYELSVLVPGTTTLVDDIKAETDEVIVLRGMSAEPKTLADNCQVWVTRDDDPDWLKIPAFAMSLDYMIPCFIPAINKLRIEIYTAGAGIINYKVRLHIGRYKRSDLLKARYDLAGASEEAISAVKAGVVP